MDCLVVQLHRVGEQLEQTNSQRMNQLFYLLRDGFLLQEDLCSMTRLLLLEILEFRASGWTLTDTAHKYYYSEVVNWGALRREWCYLLALGFQAFIVCSRSKEYFMGERSGNPRVIVLWGIMEELVFMHLHVLISVWVLHRMFSFGVLLWSQHHESALDIDLMQ